MPVQQVQHCSRCQRTNPEGAVYCYFDGSVLRAGTAAPAGTLAREFVFPSGRTCRSFDEFAFGCQEEWQESRGLLKSGVFQQFFGGLGRADLAKAATEAMTQDDADIGLTTFLGALPVTRGQLPKLDLSPRRLALGSVRAGETRQMQITLTNQGQGQLQGSIKIVGEARQWIKLGPAQAMELPVATTKEQKLQVTIDTRGVPAGQAFAGKITIVTNGGVVEVPVRMELVAIPFDKAPFQGAKTPREIAVMMKNQPKPAGPFLESGDVARWFTSNGWKYPVQGMQAKGVASVQQFFEAMGLSKPPQVQLSPADIKLNCTYPDMTKGQTVLITGAKKWVYGTASCDQPWVRIAQPVVSGPQKAAVVFEIDTKAVPGSQAEALLTVAANAGQTVKARITATVSGAPKAAPVRTPRARSPLLQPIVTMALAFLLVRLLLSPIVDLIARGPDTRWAAMKVGREVPATSPILELGGFLRLPWSKILAGSNEPIPAELFSPGDTGQVNALEFRDYFAKYLIRDMIFWTWWLGPLLGAWFLKRHGGTRDLPWGLIAGAMTGLVASATLACVFLQVDLIPHRIWEILFPGQGGAGLWFVWIIVAAGSWAALGALIGLAAYLIAPLRLMVVAPMQRLMGGICRACGLDGLAQFCITGSAA